MSRKSTLPANLVESYPDKTIRRIPGTDAIGVWTYRASDGSYSHVAIYNSDGQQIGQVSSHQARLALARGWHNGYGAYNHRKDSWSTLTEAALHFGANETEA